MKSRFDLHHLSFFNLRRASNGVSGRCRGQIFGRNLLLELSSCRIMANPSIVLSDLQACRCSSTVKVYDFRKRARWRADGVDMLLLSWLFSHGELIATVYEIKMPKKDEKSVEPAVYFPELFPDVLGTTCGDGMKGYLSPCSGETHPLIFRSPVKGMEGILTNQLM
ncbi:hypothetical protein F2Q68_00024698 [Brassica cretica]|uniref:Uncharacterized protein n=1 Tax=Brassica cretica TaxID=69181 RepID=A0A8S9I8A8_BRACR|nr:hypothetical protein F2Q68_00024698 [Brassica cretica]